MDQPLTVDHLIQLRADVRDAVRTTTAPSCDPSTTIYPAPRVIATYYDRIRAADAWQYAYHRATPAGGRVPQPHHPAAATRRDAS